MKHTCIIIFTTITICLSFSGCSMIHCDFQKLYSIYENNCNSINDDLSHTQNINVQETYTITKSSMEDKYKVILESKKDYSEMTDSEKEDAQELINNWTKLSMNFKSKYIKSEKHLKENLNRYNSLKSSEKAAQEAEEFESSFDTDITYDNIIESPEDYTGKKVTFTGRVIQTCGGDTENDMKIAVDNNTNKPILVGYDPSVTELTLNPDSHIIIRGIFIETISDLSLINGETRIPKIYANQIEVIN